jgi:hypothetical protein
MEWDIIKAVYLVGFAVQANETIGEILDEQEAAEKEAKMIAEFNAKQVTLDEFLSGHRASGDASEVPTDRNKEK